MVIFLEPFSFTSIVLFLFALPILMKLKDRVVALAFGFTFLLITLQMNVIRIAKDPGSVPIPLMYEVQTMKAYAYVLGFLVFITAIKTKWILICIAECFFFGNLGFTLYNIVFGNPIDISGAFDAYLPVGLVYNPSLNADMLAISFAMVSGSTKRFFSPYKIPLLDFVLWFLIYKSHSATAIICYAATKIPPIYHWINGWAARRELKLKWPIVVLAISIIAAMAISIEAYTLGKALNNDRWKWYKFYISYFLDNCNYLTGCGVNHFHIFGPSLQVTKANMRGGLWFWLHSEPLQNLFEAGFVSLLLWVTCYVKLLFKTLHRHPEFCAAALGLGIVSCFYFPLHSSAGILMACLCAWPLFQTKEKKTNETIILDSIGDSRI